MPSFFSALAEEFLLPGMRNEKAIRKQMSRLVDLGVGIIADAGTVNKKTMKYWFLPLGEVKELDRLRIVLSTLDTSAEELLKDYFPSGKAEAHQAISGVRNSIKDFTSYIYGEEASVKLAVSLLSLKSFRAERLQLLEYMKAVEEKVTSVQDLFPSSFKTSTVYATEDSEVTFSKIAAEDSKSTHNGFFEEWQSQHLINERNLIKLVLHHEGDLASRREFVEKVVAAPGSEDVLVGMFLHDVKMEEINEAAGLPGTYLRKLYNFEPHVLDFDYRYAQRDSIKHVYYSAAIKASLY
jgi:hypothetical protein